MLVTIDPGNNNKSLRFKRDRFNQEPLSEDLFVKTSFNIVPCRLFFVPKAARNCPWHG